MNSKQTFTADQIIEAAKAQLTSGACPLSDVTSDHLVGYFSSVLANLLTASNTHLDYYRSRFAQALNK